MDNVLSYDGGLLKRQIAENSRLIDQFIQELRELNEQLNAESSKSGRIELVGGAA